MSEIILINKIRYLENGKKAPSNSRFKGKMSIQSLTGLVNYTGRENAKTNTQDLLSYSSKIEKHQTLTHLGYIDSAEKEKIFRENVAKYFKNKGDVCWDTIVSLPSFEVGYEHGLYNATDYTQVVSKGLQKFFIKNGMKLDNMIFWIDHHNDTDNPHCHVGFIEKNKTLKSGYFSERKIDQLKKSIATELLYRKALIQDKETSYVQMLKEKDIEKQEVKKEAAKVIQYAEDEIGEGIKKLYSIIDRKGRLSYNSIHMKAHRYELDLLVEQVLSSNDEIKKKHLQFKETLLKLDEKMNTSINSQRNTMLENEEQKLRIEIANHILKSLKDYHDMHPPTVKKQILDIIPTIITKSQDTHQFVHYPDTNIKIKFTDKDVVSEDDVLKSFKIVNTKLYHYMNENGESMTSSGSVLYNKIQKQLYQDAKILKNTNTLLIHNTQLEEIENNKVQVHLQLEKVKFQVEKNDIKKLNHLYSEVRVEKEKYLSFRKQFQYIEKDTIIKYIERNTETKDRLDHQPQRQQKIIPKTTAKKIGKQARKLGLYWMNKVESETERAIEAYLHDIGK